MPPPFLPTMLARTRGASLHGAPFSSSAHPSGSGLPVLLYISSLPRVTTVVEASKKNGYGSAGAATAIGFDPIMALRAKVGTMIASELVQEKPMRPRFAAIWA